MNNNHGPKLNFKYIGIGSLVLFIITIFASDYFSLSDNVAFLGILFISFFVCLGSFIAFILKIDPSLPPLKEFFNVPKSIIIGILVFIVANGLLYVGQEFYYSDDVKRCESLSAQLESQKKEIDSLEKNLNAKLQQKNELERIEEKLKSIEKHYQTNADYKVDYLRYNNLIKSYNSDIHTLRLNQTKYIFLVRAYNVGVDEYNQLAKRIYSRWYLIPIRNTGPKSFSKHLS